MHRLTFNYRAFLMFNSVCLLQSFGQEIQLQIGSSNSGKMVVSWSAPDDNTEFTLQYSDKIDGGTWKDIDSYPISRKGWPISTTQYDLDLNFDLKERFYRLEMRDTAAPHQLKWFATDMNPNQVNKSKGYPDPELELSYDDEYFNIESNDIPVFEFVSRTPNGLRAQSFNWEIPRFPGPADELTQIPLLGTVAITTAGMPIYGPNEAQHPHPFGDPYINGILDYCHGHTGGQADYHFHFAPTCLIKTPDGIEQHYNIIGFALDGYPIIAHYLSILDDSGNPIRDSNSQLRFDWQEKSGFEPNARYRNNVLNGNQNSTYAWDNYEYDENRPDRTLDECNGRELGKQILADGTKFDEKEFFNFDYAYFATAEFPYIMAKYRGTPNGAGQGAPGMGNGGPGGGGNGGQPPNGDQLRGVISMQPSTGKVGGRYTIRVNLDPNANPPLPPQNIRPSSVTIGDLSMSGLNRISRTVIRGTLVIPEDSAKGKKDVIVVFPGPPEIGNITFGGPSKFEVK